MVTEKKKPQVRKSKRQFIVNAKGRATGVILPIEEYEDLQDLAAMAERENEPRVPWEDVKRRLKADGLLQD